MEPRILRPAVLNPLSNITYITDATGLELLRDFFSREKTFGWDIETTPVKDYFWRRIRTIQFGNQKEQYVIDLLDFCDGDPELLRNAQGYYGLNLSRAPNLQRVLDLIAPILSSREFLKIGINLGFEYQAFYWLLGIRAFNFFSCDLVERCIWAGLHSLKDYGFYSMESLMARYFGVQIDKAYQESFNLEDPLSQEQIEYAALDTRYPFGIMKVQLLILDGKTFSGLKAEGSKFAHALEYIDPQVTGDNLREIAQIENDAIGAFEDMHIHGERIDRERWLERVARKKIELKSLIADELDPIFLPIVGSKFDTVSADDLTAMEQKWKSFNAASDGEIYLKNQIRQAKKTAPFQVSELEATLISLLEARKAEKEYWKKLCNDRKKRETAIRKLSEKCDGEALINYGSDVQLLHQLVKMKGLSNIDDLEDETLEKLSHFPVIAAIRKYHGLAKEIGTYGEQWAIEWMTSPGKKEGWLHPGDGRLHCVFNQYDAATGRSSSEKPNGQNLPQDKEVRSCFIADPPDESIRISDCCNAETQKGGIMLPTPVDEYGLHCSTCAKYCTTHAEEYVIVTADMSGAELRIIAELADDPIWIGAFARGEDVHSVGTEILFPEEWPALQLPDCAYFKVHTAETVAKNTLCGIGHPQRQKCKCPEHNEKRNDNKSTNFLLAYGGGPHTLSARIKKTLDVARDLMARHKLKFPRIWAYLDESGKLARIEKRSFDMFGRRRLFAEPTRAEAFEKAKEDREEQLRRPEEEAKNNVRVFTETKGAKPTPDELWELTHCNPYDKQVSNAWIALSSAIERQGKNHAIQGTNATIAKLAMSCGFDANGKPYLWHTLPRYKARLIKFVHDELVVQCPKRFGEQVADLIGDAFKRAAATKMKKVAMEFEYNIAAYWKK